MPDKAMEEVMREYEKDFIETGMSHPRKACRSYAAKVVEEIAEKAFPDVASRMIVIYDALDRLTDKEPK